MSLQTGCLYIPEVEDVHGQSGGAHPKGTTEGTTSLDSTSSGGDTGSTSGSSSAAETGSDGETEPEDDGVPDDDPAPTLPDLPPGPWDFGEPIPAGEEVLGDPVAGYDALLNRGYVSCGVPWLIWPLAKPLLGQFTDRPPLPGRTGKNAEVPYTWTVHTPASGVEVVSLNCLECHAGEFNGELIIGLGVSDMDFTTVPMGSLVEDLPLFPWPGGILAEINKFAARYKAVGPYTSMLTVGTNPADMLAVRLAAHRDEETLAWSQEPLVDVPEVVIPVDPPPWWWAGKKNAHFYNGMSRGDHRGTMMFASSLCTDTVDEAAEVMDYFDDVAAYIKSVPAPIYPFSIDANMAELGEQIFTAECAGCHGTYDEDEALETYPNLIFPLSVIGTDPAVVEAADEIGYMVEWFNLSFYGSITTLELDDPLAGYVAPPLDGVWATGPFLHNGSVPTIELVLNSVARPPYWRRTNYESTNFDEEALGWPFDALTYGQDQAPEEERKFIYDTSKLGHTNSGHTFGDHLSEEERQAVIEYLKTL